MADKTDDQPLKECRILIVEDEYLIAIDIADAITRLGGTVLGPCADVATARRLLAETQADAAVLDLNLKGGKVTELARDLDATGMTIMYHTGYETTVAEEGLPDGVLALKPLKHKALMHELARALGRDCSPA